MNKTIKLIFFKLLAILLLFWPTNALAGIYDPPTTDLSVQYLGTIFGGSVGGISLSTDSSPFLGNLFSVFNGIVLAVAALILSYVGSISIINTAHEGDVMGKKWSSVWIPLRSAGGLLLLAPVPGSGYSLLQVTVMWIILNGIGAADNIWNLVLNHLEQGISATQGAQVVGSDTLQRLGQQLGPQILQSLVCLQVLQNNSDLVDLLNQTSTPIINPPSFVNTPNPASPTAAANSGTLKFGINDPNNPLRQSICGKIQISANVSPSELGNTSADLTNLKSHFYQVKTTAINSMITTIQQAATLIANTPLQNGTITLPAALGTGSLYPAVETYQNTLSALTKENAMVLLGGTANSNSSVSTSTINNAQAQGWIIAGTLYFTLNQGSANYLLDTATQPITVTGDNLSTNPLPTGLNLPGISAATFQPYANALNNVNNLFQPVSGPGSSGSFQFLQVMDAALIPLAVASPIMGAVIIGLVVGVQGGLQDFLNSITAVSSDPLLSHAQAGATLMKVGEGLLIGGAAGATATGMIAICQASSPLGVVAQNVVMFLIPIALLLAGVLWTMGATLGVYSPMIPYMMYGITALSWLMLVVEAIVAAPIVALGLITPSQEELGQITPALGIIAGVFLRPMLMVIGLIMADKMFGVMLQLIGFGFSQCIATLQNNTGGGSLLSCIPITGLYIGFVLALENKCFSLIYQIPDKILRWIGVQGESTDVSAVEQAKGAMDKATQGAMHEMQGAAKDLAKQSKKALKNSSSNQSQSSDDEDEDEDGEGEEGGDEVTSGEPASPPGGGGGAPGGAGGAPGGGGGAPGGAGGGAPG